MSASTQVYCQAGDPGREYAKAGATSIPQLREYLLTNEYGQLLLAGFFRGAEGLYLHACDLLLDRVDALGGIDEFWVWAKNLVPAGVASEEALAHAPLLFAFQWVLRAEAGWDADRGTPPNPIVHAESVAVLEGA